MFAFAKARGEHEATANQRLAWMTASLVGFAKVPEFDRVFEPARKPTSTTDFEAFFSGFDGVKIVKH